MNNFRSTIVDDHQTLDGARGDIVAVKQRLLAPYLRQFANRPVIGVGCGDLETLRHAPLTDVLCLDGSAEALAVAAEKRPDWRFSQSGIADSPDGAAALVICLDASIHQHAQTEADSQLGHIVRVAAELVVVVSRDEPGPATDSAVVPQPLSERLTAHPDVERVICIGSHRDLTFHAAVKRSAGAVNRQDLGHERMAWGMAHCPTPELLLELAQLSRLRFSFFPQTITRTLEYPWAASRLLDCAGLRVLDVGAGVSALPPWLAERGAQVVTVDNSSIIRANTDRHEWNEWGFLDFSQLDRRIVSHNVDYLDLDDPSGFDVIYSISVIEHLRAADRRRAIQHTSRSLKPGGRLLLTLDLVPNSDDLWPMAAGMVVDPNQPHGNLADIFAELEAAGLTIFEQTSVRHIPGSRTDIIMIDARKRSMA